MESPTNHETHAHAERREADSTLLELERLQTALAGLFGDARLTIELVPRTSWYSNVRSNVSEAEWDRLRRPVYHRAGSRCEICGGRGQKHPVECHEVWLYDDAAGIQRLVDLIALCPSCHGVKHLGRSHVKGGGDEAIEQLDKAGRLPPADEAALAMRDKANLILGTLLFEAGSFERAERGVSVPAEGRSVERHE